MSKIEGLRLVERFDWIDVEINGEYDHTFHRNDKPALLAALLEDAGLAVQLAVAGVKDYQTLREYVDTYDPEMIESFDRFMNERKDEHH